MNRNCISRYHYGCHLNSIRYQNTLLNKGPFCCCQWAFPMQNWHLHGLCCDSHQVGSPKIHKSILSTNAKPGRALILHHAADSWDKPIGLHQVKKWVQTTTRFAGLLHSPAQYLQLDGSISPACPSAKSQNARCTWFIMACNVATMLVTAMKDTPTITSIAQLPGVQCSCSNF